MKLRLYQFDFIRSIAALSVIAIHTTSSYVAVNDIGFIWNQAMRYAVPLFIIISGFLLYYTDKEKNQLNYFQFLNKRLKKILLPYLLWTIIYYVYYNRHSMEDIITAKSVLNIGKYLMTGLDHLYFIVIISQLYLLYPWIKIGFNKGKEWLILVTSFILTFYIHLASYLTKWNIIILPKQILSYYYILFPCWVFYFVLGMYLIRSENVWKEKIRSSRLNIIIAWLICLQLLIIESKVTMTYESSIKPIVMIYCIITFFIFYLLSNMIMNTPIYNAFFTWFSKQSFLIYLSHVIVMRVTHSTAYIIGFKNIWDSFEGMVLFYIITVMGTLIFTYCISLTPFASLLGGVVYNKKSV